MYYDPNTIEMLRETLEAAWTSLTPEQRARTSRLAIAERMLRLAEKGERDPVRLRAGATTERVPSEANAS
jgi:hypothetical protein